jgi:hypothetical protein
LTAPLDALLSFVLGGFVALACRVQLRLSPRPWYATRYFAGLASFQLLVFLPAAFYRYYFFPDWSAMYLFNASQFHFWATGGGLVVAALMAIAAFVLGNRCARARREWLLLTALAVALAGLATVASLLVDRLWSVGSFAQWQRNFGLRQLTETDLLPALLAMGVCVLVAWLYMLVIFAREGSAMGHASR